MWLLTQIKFLAVPP